MAPLSKHATVARFSPPHGAGVIVHSGRGHLLLGLHRDGWTTFAGKAEPDETPRQTALRELGEETLFVLQDAPLRLTAEPLLSSTTPAGRPFFLYGALLERDEALPVAFEEARASRRHAATPGCDETKALRWFGLAELQKSRLRPSFRADVDRIVAAIERPVEASQPAHDASVTVILTHPDGMDACHT